MFDNRSAAWRSEERYLRQVLRGTAKPTPRAVPTMAEANVPENGGDRRALAMVYTPKQSWRQLFDPAVALSRGTMFAELYKPFEGKTLTRR